VGSKKYRFDLTIPASKDSQFINGLNGTVLISVLKVGWVICGLLLLENHGPEAFKRKNFEIGTQYGWRYVRMASYESF
jgi:hypothetical protein